MPYKKQQLSLTEAAECVKSFKFALVYQLEKILLGTVEQVWGEICPQECIEARFFSEDKELHVFDYNGEYRAILVSDEDSDDACVITREVKLQEKLCKKPWSMMTVKEYIAFDEDGQACVSLTRLAGLK